ncbi:MAG TPA: hypothetical protein VFE32_03140 [Puia sp.]|jgi:hypothetical protein|nr:hypothetical protein [Puia sp.]
MTQKELITKKDYAAVGEAISHELAADFIKAYEEAYPGENRGYHLGRNIIDQILAQPGCAGMRFYYGLNEEGQKTLVYVGIDAEGNDLVKRTIVMNGGLLTFADGIIADRLGLGR